MSNLNTINPNPHGKNAPQTRRSIMRYGNHSTTQLKAGQSYATPMGSLSDAQKVLLKLAARDIRRNPGALGFPDLVRLQQELTNEIERRASQGKDEA